MYREAHAIHAHSGAVHVVRFSAGGRYLLSGGSDQQINLWNVKSGAPGPLDAKGRSQSIQKYSAHSYEVLCIDVATDNSKFASGGPDRNVFVWDVASGNVLRRFNAHYGRVNDVRFAGANNDGSVLLAAGSDTIVRAYDLRAHNSWKPIMELDDARDAILTMALSGTTTIHAGSVDGVMRTYDVRQGILQSDVIDHPITSITPTQAGSAVLVSTLDSTARLFDMTNGQELQKFTGLTNTSFRCHSTLADDEATVVAGDEHGHIYAWDLLTARRTERLAPDYSAGRKGQTPVAVLWTDANAEQGTKELATASSNGLVHIWTG
ncbi:hypothetical protein MCUN1_002913 [Malassezia cuniculi]|uniref:WD repeat domain-containing protein 83 n=1 Tax=Malassezia cuniculi TaxID=948313 RepID=A0AAF0J6Y1_9BASI|nr:hypothetical protein MCUN1_002913 [Malassezia cuniculi]